MFRALLRKEWKQLRLVRWVGLGLGLLAPVLLLVGAEAGQRGWLPTGAISGYSLQTLLGEALPAFLLCINGLLGLMISTQTFAGDRAAGTETFLLERPVSRSSIWLARLVAVVGTASFVLVAHALTNVVVLRVGTGGLDLPVSPKRIVLLVAGVMICTVLGGIMAASFLKAPMPALLLGLLLAVVPLMAAMGLGALFPMAAYRRLPVGLFVPWLLILAYVAGSFFMLCRGEPAGRRRWLRGVIALAISLVAVPLVFAVSAPVAMRLEAARVEYGAYVYPSPAGGRAVSIHGPFHSGWILDLERQSRDRFVPPATEPLWSRDGSQLALLSHSGALGSMSRTARVDILDAAGARLRSFEIDADLHYTGTLYWVDGHLVTKSYFPGDASGLAILSVETGELRSIEVDLPLGEWRILGPTDDEQLYVMRALHTGSTRVVVQRVDLHNARFETPPVLEEEGFRGLGERTRFRYFYTHELSPSGRYLLRGPAGWAMDLTTGEDLEVGSYWRSAWLDGDLLARLVDDGKGHALYLGRPGSAPGAPVRGWSDTVVTMEVAPDRRRLLVRTWPREPGQKTPMVSPGAALQEVWLYDPATDSWEDVLASFGEHAQDPRTRIHWAGPETLAATGRGFVALKRLGSTNPPKIVIGG